MRSFTLSLLLLAAASVVASTAGAQTTYTWSGGVGQWDTAANWSPAGVPGPGDTAVITAFGSEVELTSDVTVASLTLSRRLFSALGDDLTITESMAWTGGTVSLFAATLTIEAGATLELSGGALNLAGFLFNYGTILHAGTNTDLVLDDGDGNAGAVANFGLYDVTASGDFAEIRGGGDFLNGEVGGVPTGVFRKSAASARFIVACYNAGTDSGFTNRGLVEVDAGELRFDNAASVLEVGFGGSFTGTAGTALWINMRYEEDLVDPAVTIAGFDRVRLGQQMTYTGALDVSTLEVYENDSAANPDTTDMTGAALSNLTTVEVTGNYNELFLGADVAGTLDTLRVTGFGADVAFTPGGPFALAEVVGTGSSARLDFGGADVAADTISVTSNAHLLGLGDLALTPGGGMNWANGDVTVAGLFTVGAEAVVAMPSGTQDFAGALLNEGTFLHTGGSTDLVLAAGSVFTNAGLYAMATSGQFAEIRGDGAFVNDGLFVKSGVATNDNVRVDFTNDGVLDVREDELRFDEAFANGATGVVTGAGTLDLTPAASFVNDGTFAPGDASGSVPGRLTHQGDFTMNGTARLVVGLEGLTAGATHDQLAVEGNVAIAGTLRLDHLGTYLPGLGDSFTVLTATGTITGGFANVVAPAGYAYDVTYAAPNVVATVTDVPNFDLTAVNTTPLTVPAGGQVGFSYTVANNTGSSISGSLFFTAAGGYQGVIASGSLGGGQSLSGSFTQNVPASVPPGTYTYVLRIGSFPSSGVDAVPFQITVTAPRGERGDGEAAPADDWTVTDATPWLSPEALSAGVGEEAPAAGASTLPEVFALHGAAPNPFAGRTALRYDVPEAGEVRIEAFDLLGRRVAVLVDGPTEAGTHAVAFDASALPSGTYLVRMTADGFTETRRLTRVR